MARKAASTAETKAKPRSAARAQQKEKAKERSHKKAMIAIFFIGLFAVAFGTLEGLVFKSTGVYTGASGTFTMDIVTSILFILGGLIAIGFAVWSWFQKPTS